MSSQIKKRKKEFLWWEKVAEMIKALGQTCTGRFLSQNDPVPQWSMFWRSNSYLSNLIKSTELNGFYFKATWSFLSSKSNQPDWLYDQVFSKNLTNQMKALYLSSALQENANRSTFFVCLVGRKRCISHMSNGQVNEATSF